MIYPSNCVRLFLIVLVVATPACHRLTPSESKIIGTWEVTGIDFTARIVFRRDHVVVNLGSENEGIDARWAPFSSGRWRLQGSEILLDEKALAIPGHPSWKRITKIPVREFRADALVRSDGRSPLIRVSVAGERYAQLLALLAVIISLIALAACIYLIRARFFGKVTVVFAFAAALAFAWALSLLTTELTQTGAVILSMTSLRVLQSARIIVGVALIVVFTIACIRVAFAARKQQIREESVTGQGAKIDKPAPASSPKAAITPEDKS